MPNSQLMCNTRAFKTRKCLLKVPLEMLDAYRTLYTILPAFGRRVKILNLVGFGLHALQGLDQNAKLT